MVVPEWLQDQNNVLLSVALLLVLWLWLLISRRQQSEQPIHLQRKMPLNPEELGRMVFAAALSNDLRLYRSLFLNALEAREKLGDFSDQYLQKRDLQLLQKTFAQLKIRINQGTTYVSVDSNQPTTLAIIVRRNDLEVSIPIGSITQVGTVIRLLEPALQAS